MPEGPELKISCDILNSLLINKTIIDMNYTDNSRFAKNLIKNFLNIKQYLPLKIKNINVKGKFLHWSLDKEWFMFCTYGMTGQWSENSSKHTAFIINYIDDLNNKKSLYFNDPRHFGTIKFSNSLLELNNKLKSLGWCPLSESLDSNWNILKNKMKPKPIGELLMDQKIFSGVGNYIRAEALYKAKINPWKNGNDLSDEELKNLCKIIIDVMEESYRLQGASFLSYINADSTEGKYSNFFHVYGKEKDYYGNKIIKENMGTRTIHWCPALQI